MTTTSTRELILDSAQALVQSRGVNAFSYADIAADLGIKKASIHYHFPSKQDLEVELLQRYTGTFTTGLQSIAASTRGSVKQLEDYAQMYAATLRSNQVCMGGMMASDAGTLPEQLSPLLNAFFDGQVQWLTTVLKTGQHASELNFTGPAKSQAIVFLSALQGGLLIANATGNIDNFKALTHTLIDGLK